ncbi:MAG: hypothetical protein U1C96_10180 [Gallionella sp.]|nr:hypothetical protein [Gallionella sp.]
MTIAHLYRGVSAQMYEESNGELRPKQSSSFSRAPQYGKDEWGNCFYGDTPLNSVVEHQRHQAGYPTSGISTTPHFERARFYATCGGQMESGYIFIIDQALCRDREVTLYVVNDIVPHPSVIEDDEVILVAKDFGVLPAGIVVDVVRVRGWQA